MSVYQDPVVSPSLTESQYKIEGLTARLTDTPFSEVEVLGGEG